MLWVLGPISSIGRLVIHYLLLVCFSTPHDLGGGHILLSLHHLVSDIVKTQISRPRLTQVGISLFSEPVFNYRYVLRDGFEDLSARTA